MRHQFKYGILVIALSVFLGISCKKKKTVPSIVPCDLSTSAILQEENYNFDSSFENKFSQNSRWESNNADITLVNEKAQLTANSTNTSQALETWKLYNSQMPYNKSWSVEATCTVPLYWNTNGGNKAQVGIGLFAGKPVDTGQSSKVYECNIASINGNSRFVQAQLVANRLGGNPIDVQNKVIDKSTETTILKIQFCHNNKSLSFYIDNNLVGEARTIDETGLDNWYLTDNGKIDIGIMGFTEKTTITSHQPTIDAFNVKIY